MIIGAAAHEGRCLELLFILRVNLSFGCDDKGDNNQKYSYSGGRAENDKSSVGKRRRHFDCVDVGFHQLSKFVGS